jgi:hypothetical protein
MMEDHPLEKLRKSHVVVAFHMDAPEPGPMQALASRVDKLLQLEGTSGEMAALHTRFLESPTCALKVTLAYDNAVQRAQNLVFKSLGQLHDEAEDLKNINII